MLVRHRKPVIKIVTRQESKHTNDIPVGFGVRVGMLLCTLIHIS